MGIGPAHEVPEGYGYVYQEADGGSVRVSHHCGWSRVERNMSRADNAADEHEAHHQEELLGGEPRLPF